MDTYIVTGYDNTVIVKANSKQEAKQLGRQQGVGAGAKAELIKKGN